MILKIYKFSNEFADFAPIAGPFGQFSIWSVCMGSVLRSSLSASRADSAKRSLAGENQKNIDAFADLMNQKAAELGCKNTHFTNANGLHDENHYTTAYEEAHRE